MNGAQKGGMHFSRITTVAQHEHGPVGSTTQLGGFVPFTEVDILGTDAENDPATTSVTLRD